jgi:hypothetical protein
MEYTMNAQDKMNIIAPTAIRSFEDNRALDEVCSDCVSIAIDSGIAFSEILPLVKQIGRDNGYIVELADRKANFTIDMGNLSVFPKEYTTLVSEVERLAEVYNIPFKWAMPEYITWMKSTGEHVPTKPRLSGWKLCALECWQENPKDTSLQDVRKHLRANDFNHSIYTQSYHELFRALVDL